MENRAYQVRKKYGHIWSLQEWIKLLYIEHKRTHSHVPNRGVNDSRLPPLTARLSKFTSGYICLTVARGYTSRTRWFSHRGTLSERAPRRVFFGRNDNDHPPPPLKQSLSGPTLRTPGHHFNFEPGGGSTMAREFHVAIGVSYSDWKKKRSKFQPAAH